jgi:hypothetical protein
MGFKALLLFLALFCLAQRPRAYQSQKKKINGESKIQIRSKAKRLIFLNIRTKKSRRLKNTLFITQGFIRI